MCIDAVPVPWFEARRRRSMEQASVVLSGASFSSLRGFSCGQCLNSEPAQVSGLDTAWKKMDSVRASVGSEAAPLYSTYVSSPAAWSTTLLWTPPADFSFRVWSDLQGDQKEVQKQEAEKVVPFFLFNCLKIRVYKKAIGFEVQKDSLPTLFPKDI
jgi:hypothetical protein